MQVRGYYQNVAKRRLLELGRQLRSDRTWKYDNSSFETDAIGFAVARLWPKLPEESYDEYSVRIFGFSVYSRKGSYLFGIEWGGDTKTDVVERIIRVVTTDSVPAHWFMSNAY